MQLNRVCAILLQIKINWSFFSTGSVQQTIAMTASRLSVALKNMVSCLIGNFSKSGQFCQTWNPTGCALEGNTQSLIQGVLAEFKSSQIPGGQIIRQQYKYSKSWTEGQKHKKQVTDKDQSGKKNAQDDTTSHLDTKGEKGTANLDEVEGANETQVKHIHRQETWQEDENPPDVKIKQDRRTRAKS